MRVGELVALKWSDWEDDTTLHIVREEVRELLASNGVPLDAIRELLGHTELSTTLGYIYNSLPEKDTYELISKAL